MLLTETFVMSQVAGRATQMTIENEQALMMLRVNLFGAAQVLKDDDAREFWKLIDDVVKVRCLYDPDWKGRKGDHSKA